MTLENTLGAFIAQLKEDLVKFDESVRESGQEIFWSGVDDYEFDYKHSTSGEAIVEKLRNYMRTLVLRDVSEVIKLERSRLFKTLGGESHGE